jgi:hypothetical protein
VTARFYPDLLFSWRNIAITLIDLGFWQTNGASKLVHSIHKVVNFTFVKTLPVVKKAWFKKTTRLLAFGLVLALVVVCRASDPFRFQCTEDLEARKIYCNNGSVFEIVAIDWMRDYDKCARKPLRPDPDSWR